MGLRVVVDVVYNHTFASGLNQHSVLDKVVPGYYHRRMEDGETCNSTCCNNTATEHYMCERLMIDDIVHWATNYRVDAFRCAPEPSLSSSDDTSVDPPTKIVLLLTQV